MNKTEFLDLLRYYFRNAKKSEVEEILADYEAHFEEGKKRGLTEEAIAKELGSPKDIYESYTSEGVVDEKSKGVRLTDEAKEAAKEAATTAARKAGEAWDEVSPKLPQPLKGRRISPHACSMAPAFSSLSFLSARPFWSLPSSLSSSPRCPASCRCPGSTS